MNKKPICYLVGAGEYHGMSFSPMPGDFIVAVDGGLTYIDDCGMAALVGEAYRSVVCILEWPA